MNTNIFKCMRDTFTVKAMYDVLSLDLELNNFDQAMKQKQYKELIAIMAAGSATLQATLAKKKDEIFKEETESACKTKADECAEQSPP